MFKMKTRSFITNQSLARVVPEGGSILEERRLSNMFSSFLMRLPNSATFRRRICLSLTAQTPVPPRQQEV